MVSPRRRGHSFIASQGQIGSALSMGVASTLFIVESALILSVLLLAGSAIVRPLQGRGRTSA